MPVLETPVQAIREILLCDECNEEMECEGGRGMGIFMTWYYKCLLGHEAKNDKSYPRITYRKIEEKFGEE